ELNFSIVVAARNEENNLSFLVDALLKLNYPSHKYEIILINDHSADNTLKLMNELALQSINVKTLNLDEHDDKGKKAALTKAIANAKHEYIMITDADCLPNDNWLCAFAKVFAEGNDFAFGISPYIKTIGFINSLTRFENLKSHLLTFGAANLGLPYSASARNFGFKKSSFEKIFGYTNTKETIGGDDDLLIREAVKNKMKIGLVTSEDAFVYTHSKENFRDYLAQKARHTSTSLHYHLKHKILLGIWHISNIAVLLSILLFHFSEIFLLPTLVKFILDSLLVNNFSRQFGYKFNLLQFLYLNIIYEFLIVLNFFSAKKYSNKWS
ncbi:MAG: glycosyltransferase, partial [Bacteroidetes bacterium]|nr:glycosyltransferase [Bacteroidota bacterium]